jgi:hypothetical protein
MAKTFRRRTHNNTFTTPTHPSKYLVFGFLYCHALLGQDSDVSGRPKDTSRERLKGYQL